MLNGLINPMIIKLMKIKRKFFQYEINKYFPSFDANLLIEMPSYSGISPIMNNKDKSMQDFIIQDQRKRS